MLRRVLNGFLIKLYLIFQETLVEGLQRKSFRHSVLREGQYVKEEDSVDV